jgi:tripartite-type tricarboxylate transporter receptor subunit TctC
MNNFHRSSVVRRAAAVASFIALALALPVQAEDAYPAKVITMVVPFPPANSSDVAARLVAEQLSKRLKVSVVVENRVGAAGQVGTSDVARANPDGYTLLMTSTSFAISPALYKKLPYKLSDFAPVIQVSNAPMVLVVRPDFPANTLAQFVDELKKNPSKNSYAHAGVGTIQNLTAEAFLARIGQPIVAVPYRGSGPAYTDLFGGRVQFMFDPLLSALPHIQAGRLKALATVSPTRPSQLAAVPTVAESKLPELRNFTVEGWVGLLAPKRTPEAIVSRLHEEVDKILRSQEMSERLASANVLVAPSASPQAFGDFLRSDIARWEETAAGAKIEKE